MPELERPIIQLITRARGGPRSHERQALLDRLEAAARAGISMVQVRERQFADRALLGFVRDAIDAVRDTGAVVVVNDRIDIALCAGAAGVHLKSDSPMPLDVRRLVARGFLVGRSVHTTEDARQAAAGGCDYLLFGTVFPSRSKPDGHAVAGTGGLAEVCAAVSAPVVAIGGITPERAREVLDAGAAGVAAISYFLEASDIDAAVGSLRRALTSPHRSV